MRGRGRPHYSTRGRGGAGRGGTVENYFTYPSRPSSYHTDADYWPEEYWQEEDQFYQESGTVNNDAVYYSSKAGPAEEATQFISKPKLEGQQP